MTIKQLIIIVAAISILWPQQLTAQTRRALIIGIGEQSDRSWTKINGDKDVPYVKEMLSRSGFTDIATLVNRQATKEGILSAFGDLTEQCEEGDMVYVHFSGHGQQVSDVDGDEVDGWDEAWIPYDACLRYDENKYRGEKHLLDDELNILLTAIRNKIGSNGRLLVVVDACHSGDSSHSDDDDESIRGSKDSFVIPVRERGNARRAPERWLTLSACKDYQLNQEMKEPKVGKLTYALYSISGHGIVTVEGIRTFMHNHRGRYVQTPVLTGDDPLKEISDFFQ